jgi:hypothetical protein
LANLFKRLFVLWIISSLIVAGLVFGLLKFYGEPFVKTYIESDLAEKIGMKITLQEVKIKFIPPMSIRLEGLDITSEDGTKNVTAESVDIFVDVLKTLPTLPELNLRAQATLVRPIATIKLPFVGPQAVAVPAMSSKAISVQLPGGLNFSLDLDIQEGSLSVEEQNEAQEYSTLFKLEKTFCNFKSQGFDREMDLNIFTNISSSKLSKNSVPLEIKTKFALDLEPLMLKIVSSAIFLGGIPGNLTGTLNPASQSYKFDLKVDVADLGKIRSFAFPGTWQGALTADLKFEKIEKLKATGTVQAKNVYGDLEYGDGEFNLNGSMGVNGITSFTYADRFRIDSMSVAANLTNMNLTLREFFKKDRGVPLTGLANLSQDQASLKINALNFELGHLKGSLAGHFGSGEKSESNFKLAIAKTPLAGMEKFFPIIRTPLTGFAEANIEVRGKLSEPDGLFIDINPLILNQVKVDALWKSKDETRYVEGALLVNTRSNFRIQNQQLTASTTDTQIDFSKVGIIWADTFIKPLGNTLRLDVYAAQKDKLMQITRAELTTPAGVVNVTGNFRDPLKPTIKIKAQTPQMDLSRLTLMIPMLRKWKLSGKINGDLSFDGRYEPKLGIEGSPLRMEGTVKAFLPEFAYVPEVPIEGKIIAEPEPDPKRKKIPAILPPWPILLESSVRTELSIGKLFFKDIILSGIKWKGALDRGTLVGQGDIKEVFGGTLIVGKLKIPMKDAQPTTQLNAVWGNLQAGKAFDWLLPDWKGLFSGVSNGSIDLVLLHPDNPDFTLESVVRGKGTLKNGFISTLKFDQAVNAKLAQVPGLGSQTPFTSKGMAGNVDIDFEFNKKMLRFRNFDMVTPEKNEFHGGGWIRTDKTIDIKGEAHITNPSVQGSVVQANSDKEGRLVVPIQFEGTVTEPKLNIADQTIKTMLAKTAEFEGKRLRGQAQKALNIEVEGAKKKIGDELGKGLKKLLGK